MAMPLEKDYLILNLRLGYLRKIEDRAGPRVITVPDIVNAPVSTKRTARASILEDDSAPSQGLDDLRKSGYRRVISDVLPPYAEDSQVVLAGLNDATKHPELMLLYSPDVSVEDLSLAETTGEDDSHMLADGTHRSRATSLGTGGLKHTTTIYGPGQTGALGMRVSGQRKSGSLSRRRHPIKTSSEADATHSDSAIAPPGRRAHRSQSSNASTSSEVAHASSDLLGWQVPALAIQASTYTSEDKALQESGQDPSPRNPREAESSAMALLHSRNRSRSQPHRPSLPSGLSNVSTAPSGDVIELSSNGEARAGSSVLPPPPPRPPRKPRQSLSGQSTKSASAIPTSGNQADGIDQPESIEGRQRSQSEAIKPNQTHSELSASHGTSSGDNSVSRFGGGEPMAYMNRTHSESTLFSLASPRSTRRRGLSNKSQQSDGSTPSFDLSVSAADRFQQNIFAPVDEHPETTLTDGGRTTFATVDPYDNEAEELLLASDIEAEIHSPVEDDRPRSIRSNFLDPWDISSRRSTLTPFNVKKPEIRASDSDSVLAASIKAPHLADVDSEAASTVPPSSAALSPDVVGTVQGAQVSGQIAQAQSFGSAKSASPFFKTDPITVKKNFDQRAIKSALTALINKRSEGPSNPFTQLYKGVAGSSVSGENSTTVEVFFPFAHGNNAVPAPSSKARSGALVLNPRTRSMQLSVRKDAQMEELIGYSLYCYVEEDWRPRLDEALAPDASEEQREIRLSTLGWALRLVEDGEVDDDYPALDRNLTVGKFGADELAVCEATPAQVRQNQAASATAAKRPRQLTTVNSTLRPNMLSGKSTNSSTARRPSAAATASAAQVGTTANMQGSSLLSSTLNAMDTVGREPLKRGETVGTSTSNSTLFNSLLGGKSESSGKAPVFLRILVTPNQDVRYKTTLQVTSDRYLADVLETICKRRELGNAEKWAFVVPDKDIVVPLDRTVESLQGNYDLALVKRQDLGAQQTGALTTQSTNPNASIFKHASRQDAPLYGLSKDLHSVYKSYTVNRRLPTFLARHERILTIDGDWLHIIPTDSRGYQTQSATTSYPVSSIVSCSQARLPSSFKLVVERESDQKRYDFEAENSKLAAEIVQEINKLMKRR